MTNIVFFRDSSQRFSGFFVKGHSGYAAEGCDIVCAAVSSCCELILNQLCDSFGFDISTEIDPAIAAVGCDSRNAAVSEESRVIISRIIDGFYRTAADLEKQYPRFIKCSITEV